MVFNCRVLWIVLFIFPFETLLAQQSVNDFLNPSDTLHHKRRNIVLAAEVGLTTSTLIALNELWYKDFPKSDFHFKNDNADWLQMDKAGHVFSSYHLGKFGSELWQWSGASKQSQQIYGAGLGFAFLTTVEVLDGYSSQWGFSWGDVAANASGTVLFLSQDLLWEEQRIIPKFSFHKTPYASIRPELLGSTFSEQILKDYNGQTYWLSVNLNSFMNSTNVPSWINLAFGYGGEGMITSQNALVNTIFLAEKERVRQFYVSFDVDLSRIKTRSSILKTLFSVFNTVKIPAPTIEINGRGHVKTYFFYF